MPLKLEKEEEKEEAGNFPVTLSEEGVGIEVAAKSCEKRKKKLTEKVRKAMGALEE